MGLTRTSYVYDQCNSSRIGNLMRNSQFEMPISDESRASLVSSSPGPFREPLAHLAVTLLHLLVDHRDVLLSSAPPSSAKECRMREGGGRDDLE